MVERALVFANGELPSLEAAQRLFHPGDLLIAADAGARHLLKMHLLPDLLIGDLDSLTESELAEITSQPAHPVLLQKYPTHKDETDLELALRAAREHGCTQILVVAALGGRVDHTLGNMGLLLNPDFETIELRLDDGITEVFLIRDQCVISGTPGDLVSLIPYGTEVNGVTTENLEYPLINETLYPFQARGISNVMVQAIARVSVGKGVLICVHIRKYLQEKK